MASSDRGSSCNVSQPKMQEPLLESRADIQSQAYRGLNVPWASLDSYYARSVDNPSDSRSSEKAGMSARIVLAWLNIPPKESSQPENYHRSSQNPMNGDPISATSMIINAHISAK